LTELNGGLEVRLRVGELFLEIALLFEREAVECRRAGRTVGQPRAGHVGKRWHQHRHVATVAVDERDQHVGERTVCVADRLGDHREAPRVAAEHQAHHGRVAHAFEIASHAVQGAGHDAAHVVAEQIEQVLCRTARFDLEQRADAAERIDQLTVLVDEKTGRHEAIEQPIVDGEQLRIDARRTRRGRWRGPRQGTAPRQGQLEVARQADVAPLPIDLGVLVDRVELVDQAARTLTESQKQDRARLQREVEQRQHGLLRVRLEVDQEIAARDQVHLGEGRVADQIVRGEHDALAQGLRDLVPVRLGGEEPSQPSIADAGHLHLVVHPRAGQLERGLVNVGRQDLDLEGAAARRQALVEEHGDRIRFLAGRAAGHPDPDVLVGVGAIDQLRDDPMLERLEGFLVAKEASDADQEVLVERAELARIAADLLDIGVDVERPVERQAALDSARDRAGLVVREVDAVFVAEQPKNRFDAALFDRWLGRFRLHAPLGQFGQRQRDFLGRQHLIDLSGAQRAERHAVELGRIGAFAQHHPACLADFLHAPRAVAAAARQDDCHRAIANVVGERAEEKIDRQRQPVTGVAVVQQQPPLPDDHFLHRRQQIDDVGLDRHVVFGLTDAQLGAPRQQLVHQALEVGREMLEHHERHTDVGGDMGEQPFE
jgi:hypothetical protein